MATYVRTQEIAHDVGAAGRFALRVTNPEVDLRGVAGERASVRVKFELRAGSEEEANQIFDRIRFHAREADGMLEVAEPRRSDDLGSLVRLLGDGGAAQDISVSAEVPSGAEIAYEGVSADVTASRFSGTQAYRTVSGDLVLDQVSGDLRVRSVSSDVSVRASDPVSLEMHTVSGDVSAEAPRFDQLRIVTVSGDVEIEGDLPPDVTHRVETVSGDLSLGIVRGLTLEVRGLSSDVQISVPHRSEGSRDRRRFVVGDGQSRLQFSSMSGDAIVRASRRLSAPLPPVSPTPPMPPMAPRPPAPPLRPIDDAQQLAVLRALESGEIDVDEAARRLAEGGIDA